MTQSFAMFRSYAALAAAALAVFAGPAMLWFGLGSPWIRNNYWLPLAVSVSGAMLAMLHAVARRSILSFAAGILLDALGVGFVIILILGIRVPGGLKTPEGAAHDFELSSVGGEKIKLSAAAAASPRIMVFFRGAW